MTSAPIEFRAGVWKDRAVGPFEAITRDLAARRKRSYSDYGRMIGVIRE